MQARKFAQGATRREQRHIAALEALSQGAMAEAALQWENALQDHPTDALALLCAHQCDFFLGRSSQLRDRVARRLGSVAPAWPGYGFYQGMYAFGLEEMNQYAAAEDAARQAVELCGRDAWAIHAFAHVMEMTGRTEDGARFLRERESDWSTDNFFQAHNWWHLALYLLEDDRFGEALELYDTKIKGGESTVMLDMVDASALLWRLTLRGVDSGDRWQKLAALWEPRIGDAWYSFNDTHAMMAFAASGNSKLVDELLSAMTATAVGTGENALNTRLVGLPVATALAAYAQGDHARTVELLLATSRFVAQGGGSHAQRDVLTQTLIRAAELSGEHSLAVALLNERVALKPRSPVSRLWRERAIRHAAAAHPPGDSP